VLVEGEPGIGKSSLIRAAAAEAAAAGSRVFWASCDELSQAFPLVPLLDALDTRRRGQSTIARIFRATDVPGNTVDLVAAAVERLLAQVDAFCAAAPAMLVVDDLQWADQATVMALGRLARSVQQVPLLVVGLLRPVPVREDLVALRRIVEPSDILQLGNLSASAVADLVGDAVGGPPGPRLLRLAAGAGGNPLYLTEWVDALVRAHALVVEDDCVEVAGAGTPVSLAAAIADRLEFLSPPARGAVRAAALLGVDFSVSDLAAVSGQRVTELLPVLDEAILAGVLLDNGAELSFRHPLIRAALYDGMPAAVRAAWQRDAARALAEDGAPADRVARQLLPALKGGDAGPVPVDEWVVRWLADASLQLIGHAPHVAVPLLRWAVSTTPSGGVLHDLLASRLADVLYRVGDARGAAEVASGALAHKTHPDLLVGLHWTLAQCRAVEGRSDESLETLQKALEDPTVADRDRARLLVLSARTHRSLGHTHQAGKVAQEALRVADAAGDRWATAWALGMLTVVHGSLGEPTAALPLFDRALSAAEGDPALIDLRLLLQINQAVALGDIDRYEDAIRAASEVRRLADEAGNVVRLAQAQSALSQLFFGVGRWDDALAEVDAAGSVANPTVECCDRGIAATIQLHRGEAEAGRHLAEGERYAARLGTTVIAPYALAKSLEREQADEPKEALEVLMDGLADPTDHMGPTADLLADAVRLAVSVGDRDTAHIVVNRAEAVAEASDVPHRQAVAPHCRGLLDHDPAPLLQAADRYRAAGRMLPRAQALEAAGVALADRGDLAGARTRFTEAYSVYSALGASWDLARTQATFRTYGIRRGPNVTHRRDRQGWNSLTPTEAKIVGLVANGMSNPQIAAHLFLSRRTVQTHVSHILAKLNMNSRIDIAREASRRSQQA
jgi:DNA-binding NarL/FixJ family response regulator